MRFFAGYYNKNGQFGVIRFTVFTLAFVIFIFGSLIAAYWQWTKYLDDRSSAALFNRNLKSHITLDQLEGSDENTADTMTDKLLHYNGYIDKSQNIVLTHSQLYDSPGSEIFYLTSGLNGGKILLLDIGWYPSTYPTGKVVESISNKLSKISNTYDITCRLNIPDAPVTGNNSLKMDENTVYISSLNKKTLNNLSNHYQDRKLITGHYCVLTSPFLGYDTPPYVVDQPNYKYGPYLSYVFQWLLFSIIFSYLYIRYVLLIFIVARKKVAVKRN